MSFISTGKCYACNDTNFLTGAYQLLILLLITFKYVQEKLCTKIFKHYIGWYTVKVTKKKY